MNQTTITRLVEAVLQEGKPIKVGWYDDGDAESGPSGGALYGFRWGKVKLIEELNGSISLVMFGDKNDPLGLRIWAPIYNSCAVDRQPHSLAGRAKAAIALLKREWYG